MKCILLTVLACVVALEAKPQPYLGLGGMGLGMGTGIGTGLGTGIGTGIGTGAGLGLGLGTGLATGLGTGLGVGLGSGLGTGLGTGLGLGLGMGGSSSGFSQGNGYGGSEFSNGASGMGSQGFHSGGLGNFHNVGGHHSSLNSITQADNSDMHDIGGGQAFDTGAQSGNGFNQYGNGGSHFGNGYGSGQQMSTFI